MSIAAPPRAWFGQPPGLTILFLTEMWEKFSYYGMRALLVYYMTKQLLFSQEQASMVYGLYTALAYLSPVFGGLLADRWLGKRRAVVLGGVVMAFGHFLMAFDALLYPALLAIVLGNGLFLPTLPGQVGDLYRRDDPRRGSAFNVYYVGINLGAFLAPLVCGTLGEVYGWHVGFSAAGIGMLLGLVVYISGRRHLPPDPPRSERATLPFSALWQPTYRPLLQLMTMIAGLIVVFRLAYEQIGNTIAIWLDTGVDRVITADFTVPMTWFFSLNPLLVFLITPLLVRRWTRQAREGREPAALTKMAIGAAVVGLSFALVAMLGGEPSAKVGWLWAALFFAIFTLGELFILPVGLGLFARLAPAGFGATIIAFWFLASFGGNLLAGAVGTLWSTLSSAVFFSLMGGTCMLVAILLLRLERRARPLLAGNASPAPQDAAPAARAVRAG
ncbi:MULTISPECIES: peptide MFS transporter [unclassified Stenotrophomonas]|uniref:peptide MFS transporter n=1 Tax=unclassified Stenotrophomonas TaxID=196198 RepID=UPI002118D9AE|nr:MULTISPECIES: peptide MFS transporter [unclassified Stenotrophomonas]